MPKSHHSQSGPVIVRKVADPVPPTPAEQRQRLLHKLALIEDRIADRESFHKRYRTNYSTDHLTRLILQREGLKKALASFGET